MSGRPILANGLKVKPKKFRSECVAHDKDCSLRGDFGAHQFCDYATAFEEVADNRLLNALKSETRKKGSNL